MKMSSTHESKKVSLANHDRAEPVEIWKTRNFIRDHSDEKISLHEIAKAINISANYLSEKFKKITGINFVDYVAHTRIEKASDLLHNVNLRISEIAFAVGFQSLSQFNRVFKKLTGQSPTEFRAAHARHPKRH
jgi:YesN/AraC family two-component response regulator